MEYGFPLQRSHSDRSYGVIDPNGNPSGDLGLPGDSSEVLDPVASDWDNQLGAPPNGALTFGDHYETDHFVFDTIEPEVQYPRLAQHGVDYGEEGDGMQRTASAPRTVCVPAFAYCTPINGLGDAQYMDEPPPLRQQDPPVGNKRAGYQCLVDGCKQKPFSRSADLDRHQKMIHRSEEQKDKFPCDYVRCSRKAAPFHRKDHFRDHLRDYHKEDLPKKPGHQNMTGWLDDRIISPGWWRCTKCLKRIDSREDAWECPKCGIGCEKDRVDARNQRQPEGLDETTEAMSSFSLKKVSKGSSSSRK